MDHTEAPMLVYDRVSGPRSRNLSADVTTGLAYQWGAREGGWGRPEHELETQLRSQRSTRSDSTPEEMVRDSVIAGDVLVRAELTLVDEGDVEEQASIDVDYTRPSGDGGRIEISVRSG